MSTAADTFVEMRTPNAPTDWAAVFWQNECAAFYGNPSVTPGDFALGVDSSAKGKGKERQADLDVPAPPPPGDGVTGTTGVDEDMGEDWKEYNPPAALTSAPNVTDDVLLGILRASIENIKSGIEEEKQLQAREAEREMEPEEESREDDAAENVPAIEGPVIPEPNPTDVIPVKVTRDNEAESSPSAIPGNGEGSSTSAGPPKTHRKSRRIMERILSRFGDKEGSSSSSKGLFKVGSNASKSSIDASSSSDRTKAAKTQPLLVECVSCLDEFPPKQTIELPCHNYCISCFLRLVKSASEHEQHWPPKCCLNEVPQRVVLRHVPRDLGRAYTTRLAEWALPVGERLYCHRGDCGLWIPPYHADPARRTARCAAGHRICTLCRGAQHAADDECPEDRDLALTHNLAEDEGWQHCGRCNALVEHSEACQHITCRCGHQFCYVCGLRWLSCECTVAQLMERKDAAAQRRQAREQREQQADAELRDALRQIDEFEREEARKAELLRAEAARLEEDRAQRQLEERVKQESLRRHEADVKFAALRTALDAVHDLQEVMVRFQHDKECELDARGAEEAAAELAGRNRAELAAVAEAGRKKKAAKEKGLAAEHAARAREEKAAEDAYKGQLDRYFATKPDGEQRAAQLMREFRRRMDVGWLAWSKWRDDAAARHKHEVDMDVTIRKELMAEFELRHADCMLEARTAMQRRQAAEVRWTTLIIAERVRMLAEMKTMELEDGGETFYSMSEGEGEGEKGSS
ncbi:ATP-dependent RNA helicase DEAH12 [Colletotrichum spinosum]|uniref:ATP-dependent RNA helicase DEAH12 n=1 Tax=Colletotrichum spinosum TaxID=1347390 RepID=A0A4R8PUF5_9PEZI|nr:ATP-dependent RNA helicase DEAH12 [Colletotrichum spinosum]